jgi:hypothetical protein
MTEPECTAAAAHGDAPPNILFTPPCACPRCAPERTYEQADGSQWLRLRGHRQRYRVEVVPLGETGRAVLG